MIKEKKSVEEILNKIDKRVEYLNKLKEIREERRELKNEKLPHDKS